MGPWNASLVINVWIRTALRSRAWFSGGFCSAPLWLKHFLRRHVRDTSRAKNCARTNHSSAKRPPWPVSRQKKHRSVQALNKFSPAALLRKVMPSSGILSLLPFAGSIEKSGEQFFQTGRLLVITLGMFIDAVKEMRFSGLERFYAPRFSGNSLGLNKRELESERDGISTWRFSGDNATLDSKSAITEWQIGRA